MTKNVYYGEEHPEPPPWQVDPDGVPPEEEPPDPETVPPADLHLLARQLHDAEAPPGDEDPADLERQHRGHVRLAYRLATWYPDKLLHVARVGWFTWDGIRWAEDLTGHANQYVRRVIRRSWSEALGDKQLARDVKACDSGPGIRSVLDVASTMTEYAHTADDLDPDPYLLNTPAGTLDLRTGEIGAHNPADLITKVTRGSLTRGTDSCPDEWTRFLERVLPDPDIRTFLQRIVGVSLLGTVREHVLPILTGTGANGKTVFYTALVHALGDYALVAEPNLLMHREDAHPTTEMDLLGRRLVIVSESDRDRRLAEASVKRLTGGDQIRARRMRRDFVSFTPSHTPMLITNHLPRVSGDDPALWRRLLVVPWNVVIPEDERNPELGEELQLAANQILTWARHGHLAYTERGSFLDAPEPVRLATEEYRSVSDDVGRFLDERTYRGGGFVRFGDLFNAWQKWAATEGMQPMTSRAFGQALDLAGYPADRLNTARIRRGLTLLAEEEKGDGDA